MLCGYAVVLVTFTFLKLCAAQVIELHKDARWTLHNSHGFANVTIKDITVPSYVLEVLQDRGFIGDPLYR